MLLIDSPGTDEMIPFYEEYKNKFYEKEEKVS